MEKLYFSNLLIFLLFKDYKLFLLLSITHFSYILNLPISYLWINFYKLILFSTFWENESELLLLETSLDFLVIKLSSYAKGDSFCFIKPYERFYAIVVKFFVNFGKKF